MPVSVSLLVGCVYFNRGKRIEVINMFQNREIRDSQWYGYVNREKYRNTFRNYLVMRFGRADAMDKNSLIKRIIE